MESLGDVLKIIPPGVWMASVDLQDAYYNIPVHSEHQKYLTQICCLCHWHADATLPAVEHGVLLYR